MDAKKRKGIERRGWSAGTVQELLGLTVPEAAFVELRVALAMQLRERRVARRLTQAELSRMLKSSQSRVAKMEAGDSTVSLDLLVRSLLAIGATRKDLARAIGERRKRAA